MTDIILLTIDSLRRDHFSPDFFSESWNIFYSEFAIFENCLSNGVSTPHSFPSIHTGYPVKTDGTLQTDVPTIAETFDGPTWAISNNPHLRSDRGYDRGFDYFSESATDIDNDDASSNRSLFASLKDIASKSETIQAGYRKYRQITGESSGIPTENLAEHILAELREEMNRSEGFFWVHFEDPHFPFKPQKVLDREVTPAYSDSEIQAMNQRFSNNEATDEDLDFLYDCYGDLVRYLDRQLAEFFDYLKTEGRWKETMIVVMSDHGEAFGDQGLQSHPWDANPIDALIHVPLLVKYPEGEHAGSRYSHLVQNRDLFATFADELGWQIESPENTHPFTNKSSRTVISKSNAAIRVTTESGYAIRRSESTDVFGEVSKEAKEALESATFPTIETLSGDIPGLDEREQENLEQRLEQLGYK